MEKFCINCVYEREPVNFEPCLSCFPNEKQNFIPKPMTNADKIRQLTDEELATLFVKVMAGNSGVQLDGIWQENGMEENQRYFARLNWLDWLKKEVESNAE